MGVRSKFMLSPLDPDVLSDMVSLRWIVERSFAWGDENRRL
ncbi:hypothetical protein X805_36970 [Sphaerotilus natans subsp. natans DSM 6575]|uniref:Uncharacterized protein n=1 Tax=Sphaerotilus natans subsp. natans DSM 6575 TaxID=1286631 RepID=A0A059KH60_9BURK|nr:hypothetical protein X805_36970 [Sphaerotilus natans subsp. natans DSM 6575]